MQHTQSRTSAVARIAAEDQPLVAARLFLAAAAGDRRSVADAVDILAEGAPDITAARDSILAAVAAPAKWRSPYPADRDFRPDVVQICIALARALLEPAAPGRWTTGQTLAESFRSEAGVTQTSLEDAIIDRLREAAGNRQPAYTDTSVLLPKSTRDLLDEYVLLRGDKLRRKSKVAAIEHLVELALAYDLSAQVVIGDDADAANLVTQRVRLPTRVLEELNRQAADHDVLLRTEINNRIVLACEFDMGP